MSRNFTVNGGFSSLNRENLKKRPEKAEERVRVSEGDNDSDVPPATEEEKSLKIKKESTC